MAAGTEDTTAPTGYSLPPGVTVADVKAAVAAYVKSKGENPSTNYIIKTIIPKIQKDKQAEVTERTDEQARKDKEILTPEGLDSLYQSWEPKAIAPIVTGEPTPPTRSVSSNQANLDAASIEKGSLRTLHGGVKGATYSGQLLVDENGNITQFPSTDRTSDQMIFLFTKLKQTGQLSLFLSKLEDKGFYQGQKPSQLALTGNSLGDTDTRAFDSYIQAANIAKLTPMAFVSKMMSLPSAASVGGTGGPQISSVEAARYLRQESFTALGRPLTPPEIKIALAHVKSMVASKINPDVAAQEEVLTAAPEEAATYSLGLALNRMFGA